MQSFTANNPDYKAFVERQFNDVEFIQELGITLDGVGPGWIDLGLVLRPAHCQQNGFAHFGVMATMADHSGGMAAAGLCAAERKVLTVEYKINLLRLGIGQRLRCRSEVLQAGDTITVSESEVFAIDGDLEKLNAKATVTLALV